MDILSQHEVFEIEVLEKMNSSKMLDPLIFGGGSMLRLCHELNRYSVDLDFWFVKTLFLIISLGVHFFFAPRDNTL